MPFEPIGGAEPSAVLAAYLEPLVSGRRVAVLGRATLELPARLAERGARLVHAFDPDPARVAEALSRAGRSGTVSFAVLEDDLGVRDGAFDLVITPDLSLFGDPSGIVRRARRLVSTSGVAVFSSPNVAATRPLLRRAQGGSAPLGYYDLFDAVALVFTTVKMVGQAPFVGYTVADFAPEGEPSVTVDQSLLPSSEEPEWFIAIASERPVELESYAVVELPIAAFADALAGEKTDADAERSALAEAQARIALMSAELERARDQKRERSRDLEAKETSAAAMAARLVELEKEAQGKASHAREIASRAGDEHVRAERLAHELRDLEEELAKQRDRATRLSKQLEDERRARTKADVELGMLRSKPELAGSKDRIEALTAELEVARQRIAKLEDPITLRPPRGPAPKPLPPPLPTKDPTLLARIVTLEAAAKDAQREVIDLANQRESALARCETMHQALTRATAAQKELEARHRASEAAHLSALADRDARLSERDARLIEREARLIERDVRLVERDKQVVDASSTDVAALEEALRKRGVYVAKLESDLRESERIGREIVADLEEALAARGDTSATPVGENEPPARGSDGDVASAVLRARLDLLAEKAAKAEADVHASSWRVAELERKLGDAERVRVDPSTTQRELEHALLASRQELAALRNAVLAGRDAVDIARAVMEQSVLLEQVSGSEDPALPR